MKTSDFELFVKKAKSISGKNTLPILDYLLIKDGTITASNLDTTISQEIDGLQELGEGLIGFSDLSKIVEKLKKTNFTLLFSSEGEGKKKKFTINVNSDKGDFKFATCDPDDFPAIKVCEQPFEYLTVNDVNTIKKVVNYTDVKEIRQYFHGVWVDIDNIVATTGILLKSANRDKTHEDSFILPAWIVKLMDSVEYNVLCDKELRGNAEYINNFKLVDNTNKISYTFKKFDDKIPSWKSIFPEKSSVSSKLTIKGDLLKELLDTASLSMNEYTSLIVFKNKTKSGELTLLSEDISFERSSSRTVKAENSGDEITIGFSHKLLSHMMKNESAPEYTFEFTTPSKSAIINDNILLFPIIVSN